MSAFLRCMLKIFIYPKFQSDRKIPLKIPVFRNFTGIRKNDGNSDLIFEFYDQNYPIPESFKEIGQFFSVSLKPVRTLDITLNLMKI